MSEFSFTVTPDDGDEFRVDAGMRDLRLWEKTFRGRSLGQLGDEAKLSATILFEIAFSAAARRGLLTGVSLDRPAESFERFALSHDISMIDDDATELDDEYTALRDALITEHKLTPEQAVAAAAAAQALDKEAEAPDPLSIHPGA